MSKLLVANWKMKLSKKDSIALAKKISSFWENIELQNTVLVSIAPSMPILSEVGNIILQKGIKLAAQDCSVKNNGAYTGETSAEILRECNCEYVILGHSERRKYQNETSELIAEKASLAYECNLTPIICVGETVQQRERGIMLNVLKEQLMVLLSLQKYVSRELIVAYEPVWAIGSGKVPTEKQIQEVVSYIRDVIQSEFSIANENLKILYGGSVNTKNCRDLLQIQGVGGLLIGGASLVYNSFVDILKSAFEIPETVV